MNKPKTIVIMGASGIGRIAIAEVLIKKGIEPEFDLKFEDADIPYEKARELPCIEDMICVPKIDNSFRGGSKGKGGKTKYRRS